MAGWPGLAGGGTADRGRQLSGLRSRPRRLRRVPAPAAKRSLPEFDVRELGFLRGGFDELGVLGRSDGVLAHRLLKRQPAAHSALGQPDAGGLVADHGLAAELDAHRKIRAARLGSVSDVLRVPFYRPGAAGRGRSVSRTADGVGGAVLASHYSPVPRASYLAATGSG